jgi:hypothetical protein
MPDAQDPRRIDSQSQVQMLDDDRCSAAQSPKASTSQRPAHRVGSHSSTTAPRREVKPLGIVCEPVN